MPSCFIMVVSSSWPVPGYAAFTSCMFLQFFCFVSVYCPNQAQCDFWLSWKNVRICNDTCWWAAPECGACCDFFLDLINLNLCTINGTTRWAYLIHWPVSYFKVTVMLNSLNFMLYDSYQTLIVSCIIFHGHIYSREIIDCPNLTKSLTLVLLSTLLSKVFQT